MNKRSHLNKYHYTNQNNYEKFLIIISIKIMVIQPTLKIHSL